MSSTYWTTGIVLCDCDIRVDLTEISRAFPVCLSRTCDSHTSNLLQLAYSLPAVPTSHFPHLTHKPVLFCPVIECIQRLITLSRGSAEKQNSIWIFQETVRDAWVLQFFIFAIWHLLFGCKLFQI